MKSHAATAEEYLEQLPEDRRTALSTVRDVINKHLPEGYVESMDWGMIAWNVPLELEPDTPNGKPLCYAALASHKNHMSLYLMGLYTDGPELAWFRERYDDNGVKLDMGKSCVRFKRLDDLMLDVLGDTIAMIPVDEFVARIAAGRGSRRDG
jgi:hypothetical protein